MPTMLEAIAAAMRRLRKVDFGTRWITFGGQDQGDHSGDLRSADVLFRVDTFDFQSEDLDVPSILAYAGLHGVPVRFDGQRRVALPGASPQQLARFLDAAYQVQYGLGQFGDYALTVEW